MEKIVLKHVKKVDFLAVTEVQCQKALAALKAGEEVCFMPETGGCATLSPDGLMRVEGIECVSDFFDVEHEEGYIDHSATFTHPLRAKVKKVVFDDKTKIICYRAFKNYKNLREIEIPDTLERIVSPFENCPKLKPYALPSHLTYISGDAFGIYPDEVVLPKGVTEINGFFKNSTVKKITLSPGIKRLGMREFYRCESLESVIFPEGLEVIASEAFNGCSKLKSPIFPKSLGYIDAFAFSHCCALEDATFLGDTEVHPKAFADSPMHKKIQRLRFNGFSPVAFDGDRASIPDFEKIKATLSGLTLSEQAMHFKTITETVYERYSYGEVTRSDVSQIECPLGEDSEVENVILCEGVIVGALFSGIKVTVGQHSCTCSASDDDGVGGSSRDEHKMIIFNG